MTPERQPDSNLLNPNRQEMRFLRKELPIYLLFYYDYLINRAKLDEAEANRQCLLLTEGLIKGGVREATRIFKHINLAMPANYENDATWDSISDTIYRFNQGQNQEK